MKTKNKQLNINATLFLLLLMLGINLLSCDNSKDDDRDAIAEDYEVVDEAYTFYANADKYDEARVKRGEDTYCLIETKIAKVTREGNILTIGVLGPKDCDVDYEVIWSGEVMLTSPPMGAIFLRAVADGCSDESEKEMDILTIDLEKTFKNLSSETLAEINFLIKDACSLVDIDCGDNCNVTVSDND